MATNNLLNESSTGIQSLRSTGIFSGVSLAGTSNQISISNGDGISGNPIYALTSSIYVTGISFNSGTNSLLAYSTGTWTPEIFATTTGYTITYNTQIGFYQKIGNIVIINAFISVASISGGTGNCNIRTLPFTSATQAPAPGPLYFSNVVTIFKRSVLVQTNATTMTISSTSSAAGSGSLPAVNAKSNSILYFNNQYRV